jgi:arsenate reductase-like glutaredoxin family protein
VNARQTSYRAREALAMVKQVNQLYVAKGKKVVTIDLRKEKPDEATLQKLLLGPTGNLRAPTLRKGKTLVVGFEPEMYRKVFG